MTQPKFEVGEMVITQHATYFSEYDGMPGVVTRSLQTRLCMDLNLMTKYYAHVYRVRLLVRGGPSFCFRPWQLRKPGSGEELESEKPARKSTKDEKKADNDRLLILHRGNIGGSNFFDSRSDVRKRAANVV